MNSTWNSETFEYHVDRFIFRNEKVVHLSDIDTLTFLHVWILERNYHQWIVLEISNNLSTIIDRFIFGSEKVVHMMDFETLTFLRVWIWKWNHHQWTALEIPKNLSTILIGLFSEVKKLSTSWLTYLLTYYLVTYLLSYVRTNFLFTYLLTCLLTYYPDVNNIIWNVGEQITVSYTHLTLPTKRIV